MPVMIGCVLLLGIAAKNAILLVEFAIEAQRRGKNTYDALFEACRERARPIVMTTVAMSAGMLPTALAIGEGAGFRTPMAVAVIGGLISSTVLSLVLVPVVYSFVDEFERWLEPDGGEAGDQRRRRKTEKLLKPEAPAAARGRRLGSSVRALSPAPPRRRARPRSGRRTAPSCAAAGEG